jgi:methylated-DNA-[protein]-cysteine S-methyltransferase
MDYRFIESPLGPVLLAGRGETVTWLGFPRPVEDWRAPPDWQENPRSLREAARQLEDYFAGQRRDFELDLAPDGTPFQRRVWQALETIPYGETWSYGELARTIGKPSASRAVGAANGRNPISIFIPCHRVIGADGSLTGYGWGTDIKARLLALEGALIV